MKYKILCALLALLMLVGCSAKEDLPAQSVPAPDLSVEDRLPTAQELGREEVIRLNIAGTEVRALLYIARGYSLYVPDDGWTLELNKTRDIVHDRWKADGTQDVSLTIYHYTDVSTMVALDRYVKGSEYSFSAVSGGTFGDPLYGTNAAGDVCEVMAAESINGVTYVIAWEYSSESAGYAPELSAIAGSFELVE